MRPNHLESLKSAIFLETKKHTHKGGSQKRKTIVFFIPCLVAYSEKLIQRYLQERLSKYEPLIVRECPPLNGSLFFSYYQIEKFIFSPIYYKTFIIN